MGFKGKRFTVWHDETLWSKTAIESGLVYGVYDTLTNKQWPIKDWIATSRQEAVDKANELNKK